MQKHGGTKPIRFRSIEKSYDQKMYSRTTKRGYSCTTKRCIVVQLKGI